jgi:hypothetical protein
MGALLSILLNFLTNNFNATKLVLYLLFTLILPVILWNFWVEITEFVLSLLSSAFQGVNTPSGGFSFSFAQLGSLAVWLAVNLRLGEAFVAFVSAITIRLTVNILMRIILR